MSKRYARLVQRLREAVLGSPGSTDPTLREGVEARAAALGGRRGPRREIPAELRAFVDEVALRAYEVTDAEVAALRDAGYSEDAIFELTASAALGAGLGRLERGLAALRGEV